nr:collagen alpha-1(III) chain-like [Vulpes vulpes]
MFLNHRTSSISTLTIESLSPPQASVASTSFKGGRTPASPQQRRDRRSGRSLRPAPPAAPRPRLFPRVRAGSPTASKLRRRGRGGAHGAGGKPKAASPWGPQAKQCGERFRKRLGPTHRVPEAGCRGTPALPKRESWIQEPTTLPPTRSQPPPTAAPSGFPVPTMAPALGGGEARGPKLTGERTEAGVGEREGARCWAQLGQPPLLRPSPGASLRGSPAPFAAATAPRLPRQRRGGARAGRSCAEGPCGGGLKPGFPALVELSGVPSSAPRGPGVRKSLAGAGIAKELCGPGPTTNSQVRGPLQPVRTMRAWESSPVQELRWEQEPLRTKPCPDLLSAGSSFASLGVCHWLGASALRFSKPAEEEVQNKGAWACSGQPHSPWIFLFFTSSPWPCNPPNCKWKSCVQVQASMQPHNPGKVQGWGSTCKIE